MQYLLQPFKTLSKPLNVQDAVMSNRHPYEQEVIEQIINHLKTSRGAEYSITGEHVPVGRKNCDYVLTSADNSSTIAIEIVRLVEAPEAMEQHRWRSILWEALKAECAKRGVSGFVVRTPWTTSKKPREINKQLAPQIATEAAKFILENPTVSNFSIEDVHFQRSQWIDGISNYAHGSARWVSPTDVTATVLDTLTDKDEQLALPASERILAVVPSGILIGADEISSKLALRNDLFRIKNADRVIYASLSQSKISTIYAREVRDYLAGRSTFPITHADLTDTWLRARIEHDQDGAFTTIKTLYTEKKHTDKISKNTRIALTQHGIKLLERGHYDDAAWIVRTFHTDPHPDADPTPPVDEATDESDTTVRGNVARLLSGVIAKARKDSLVEFLEITIQLSNDKNHDVQRAAARPLGILMAWRDVTEKGSFLLDEKLRSAIKSLWLDYVTQSFTNKLESAAATTLSKIHDLTEDDVTRVLRTLANYQADDAENGLTRFIIYFAFLRSSVPGLPKSFEDTSVRLVVQDILHKNENLRRNVAYMFRSTIGRHPEVRQAVVPLLPMLLSVSRDTQTLRFTLDGAVALSREELLSRNEVEAILRALSVAGPFNVLEAEFLASTVRDLASASSGHVGKIDSLIFNVIRDSNLKQALKTPSPSANDAE
ncbi:hypothetical protein [Archangium primigenium]|uniref:hypothetical protein n=1 Tax=[Archangium] primigenium TaxID=2792470 RepID=UPI00195DFAA3|nr:hypothetical protein [Archangium primigenium]MBM7118748.1 hypothetical protein [Archangium primigenium]